MTTGKNNQSASAVRNQYMVHGADAVRSYLLSETYRMEDKLLDSLKKIGRPSETYVIKEMVTKHRSIISDPNKKMDYASVESLSPAFLSDIQYHVMIMRTYVCMMDSPRAHESRMLEVSKMFEQEIKDIDLSGLKYLANTLSVMNRNGMPEAAAMKSWYEDRSKDGFGIKEGIRIFAELMNNIRQKPIDDTVWADRIIELSAVMNNMICDSVSRHLTSLSAYAYARAGMPKSTITEFDELVESYAETDAMRLLRGNPQESRHSRAEDKNRAVFAQRMLQGIETFRTFISAEMREKEQEYRTNLKKLGLDLDGALEEMYGDGDYIEDDRKLNEAIVIVLSDPKKHPALDVLLKEAVTANSVHYAALLTSSCTSGDRLKSKELITNGINEIRSIVLSKTIANMRNAIEILDGNIEQGDLSEISEWFVMRSAKNFEFTQRAGVLDELLTIGTIEDWVKISAEEIAKSLTGYMLSLEASSNASAGLNNDALKNLSALRRLDSDTSKFYAYYKGIGSSAWN